MLCDLNLKIPNIKKKKNGGLKVLENIVFIKRPVAGKIS